MIKRRSLLAAPLLATALAGRARAADGVLRIGYQKYGTLVLLKGRGTLEPLLAKSGVRVRWAEFAAGPALLEAMNAGAIDLGSTGEAPPILAQAAGAPIVYIANEPPAPRGEAILVPTDSPVKSVADLRGKRVALNRGSNVHYLLVRALAAAKVPYAAVTPVWLAPSEARAAFVRGDVDAWAIWDPFLAAAEATTSARTLADATGLAANRQFYIASAGYAAAHADVLSVVLSAIAATNDWIKANEADAAQTLAPVTGIPEPFLRKALARLSYGVAPLTPDVVQDQQNIADAFSALGLIARPIRVADAVRKLPV
jgi:sulfonate transport system substrate-binding protein